MSAAAPPATPILSLRDKPWAYTVELAKSVIQFGWMEVKTGELRNQLSRYLKRVRQTGDRITVMDRNRPVAARLAVPTVAIAEIEYGLLLKDSDKLCPATTFSPCQASRGSLHYEFCCLTC